SEVIPVIERTGLVTTDIEILRLHYAETLRHWRRRFAANRDAIGAIFDERFCRMWEFYLAGAELSFRNGGQMNFQMQLARAVDALPITRDYIAEAERAAKQRRAPVAGIDASQERAGGMGVGQPKRE
ncbi:MAG: class I SAM-dependent methyltransferase, partial [Acetobacteraceae bacterium]